MNKIEKLTRFLVRIALAGACVMPLASLSLPAQSAPAANTSGAVYNSRFDFATLYSYFQAHGADTDVGISYNDIRLGAYASGSYYFNRHLGLEAAFEAHPDGNNDGLYDVAGRTHYSRQYEPLQPLRARTDWDGRFGRTEYPGLLQPWVYLPQSLDVGRAVS